MIGAGVLGCLGLLLAAAPAHAQCTDFGVCIPNELAVGAGTLRDHVPREGPGVILLSGSFISNAWPLDLLLEGDLEPTTKDAPECRVDQDTLNCFDASFMVGPRWRLIRGSPTRRLLPFVNTLLGAYWRGSGATLDSSATGHFAVQLGGGLDVHWPESIQ